MLADYDDAMVLHWLGAGGDPRWDESHLLPAVRVGERLAIYRTVPAAVRDAVIRPGDYVAVSHAYALYHAEVNLGGWLGHPTVLLEGAAYPDELEPVCEREFFYRPRGAGRVRP